MTRFGGLAPRNGVQMPAIAFGSPPNNALERSVKSLAVGAAGAGKRWRLRRLVGCTAARSTRTLEFTLSQGSVHTHAAYLKPSEDEYASGNAADLVLTRFRSHHCTQEPYSGRIQIRSPILAPPAEYVGRDLNIRNVSCCVLHDFASSLTGIWYTARIATLKRSHLLPRPRTRWYSEGRCLDLKSKPLGRLLRRR